MRPIVIQSHARPLSQVRYNREGDLLFTASNDGGCPLAVFFSDDGERLGTFKGHSGAVVDIDITRDSKWLLSAGKDSSMRLWDVQHGTELFRWDTKQPARACAFANIDQRLVLFCTDPFAAVAPTLQLARISDFPEQTPQEPLLQIDLERSQRITVAKFTDCDRVVLSVGEDGMMRRWDVETGKMLGEGTIHAGVITDMQVSPDGTHVLTSSKDKSAKMIDPVTLEIIREYRHTRPVNSAAMSPLNHVLLVGGQEAADVTVTADAAGGFETRFYHKFYEQEFGQVRGHFGPVNSVAVSPDGKSFCTGGEDGFVRLQHFDMDYLATNFVVEA